MELSVNENAISLKLSLPTSKAEIRRFYEVVKLLCTTLKTKQFILEGQTQTLRDIDTLMQNDANASMGALEDLKQIFLLPTEPYIILDQIKGIEDWYLMLKDQRTVRYEDFMNAVSEKTYFDANHRIISLSQEKLDAILETWESPVD